MSFCMTMCLALLPLIFMFSCWSRDCGNSSSFFSSSSCCCWGGRICICRGGGAWAAAAAAAFCSNMWRSPVASTAAVAARQDKRDTPNHTHALQLSLITQPHSHTHTHQTHTMHARTHHARTRTHTHTPKTRTFTLPLSGKQTPQSFTHLLSLAHRHEWQHSLSVIHIQSENTGTKREKHQYKTSSHHNNLFNIHSACLCLCALLVQDPGNHVSSFFFDGHKNNFLSPSTHPHLPPKQSASWAHRTETREKKQKTINIQTYRPWIRQESWKRITPEPSVAASVVVYFEPGCC